MRRAFAFFLILCTIVVLNACSRQERGSHKLDYPDSDTAETIAAKDAIPYLTRGEWIEMLANTLGMEEYVAETPYFSDVQNDSPYFPYIQSSFEWGVLAFESNDFVPYGAATKEFVAVTAVLASATKSAQENSVEELCAFAESKGVVSIAEGSWKDGVMLPEGKVAAAVAQRLYLDNDDEMVFEETISESVKDYTDISEDLVRVDGSTVIMPSYMAQELSVGDVYIAPATIMDPSGIAMKVANIRIDGELGYISTEEPDLGDVFDDLHVSAQVAPRADQIILAPGVQLGGYSAVVADSDNDYYIRKLANDDGQPEGVNLTFNVNFTKGTVSLSPEWNDRKITVERLVPVLPSEASGVVIKKNDGKEAGEIFEKTNFVASDILTDELGNAILTKEGFEQRLDVENKFKSSYEITGSFALKNLYVKPTIDFHKVLGIPTGLDRAVIEINYDAETNLKLKGELEEELAVATMPIPVGPTGFTVELSLKLYVDASGEIQVKAEIGNNVKYEHSHGNNKKTQTSHQGATIEAAVEIEAGAGIEAMLKALGIKIINAEVTAGVNVESTATIKGSFVTETLNSDDQVTEKMTYDVVAGIETVVRAPIVKLKIGTKDTLANRLKITFEWVILSKDDAPLQYKPQVDVLNGEIPLFTYVVESPLDPDNTDDATRQADTEEEKKYDPFAKLTIEQLLITLNVGEQAYINVMTLPSNVDRNEITFTSKNASVANVNHDGMVVANGPGTAQIWVQSPDGGLQICLVSVEEDYSIKNGSFI